MRDVIEKGGENEMFGAIIGINGGRGWFTTNGCEKLLEFVWKFVFVEVIERGCSSQKGGSGPREEI